MKQDWSWSIHRKNVGRPGPVVFVTDYRAYVEGSNPPIALQNTRKRRDDREREKTFILYIAGLVKSVTKIAKWCCKNDKSCYFCSTLLAFLKAL